MMMRRRHTHTHHHATKREAKASIMAFHHYQVPSCFSDLSLLVILRLMSISRFSQDTQRRHHPQTKYTTTFQISLPQCGGSAATGRRRLLVFFRKKSEIYYIKSKKFQKGVFFGTFLPQNFSSKHCTESSFIFFNRFIC